jgi:hypothetical protein
MAKKSQAAPQTPSEDLATLVAQIKKAKKQIDDEAGLVVAAMLTLASHLAALNQMDKKNWKAHLAAIDLHRRVAARYLKLAESWLAGPGLKESQVLTRLPGDVMKLEWLGRLNRQQLLALLDQIDVKHMAREKVIAAVKDIIGPKKSPAEVDDGKRADRVLAPLRKFVERVKEEPCEETERLKSIVRERCLALVEELDAADPLDELCRQAG